ncbi:hypothetical protein P245_21020 [Comamonas thiooxydans]|uniref:Uncharacterized protein n=1 Tax=Comamonas thiooxydans TaxID=363952 RepID=A0A0E3BAY8_9BURK|nr:hypothetical protein [Comamonas thiooxydans]KGG86203.1 hypothetical protein P245_21020 [Comamonas thiooxydans]
MKYVVAQSFRLETHTSSADVRQVELRIDKLLNEAGWSEKFCGLAATAEYFFGKCGNLHGSFIGLWAKGFHLGAIALFDPSIGAEKIAHLILAKVDH